MKRIYVNEEKCIGCHLCEFNCAYANSGVGDIVKALKGKTIYPNIRIEGDEDDVGSVLQKDRITYAVSCRHCDDPLCVKSCISGALTIEDGTVKIDRRKCVGCLTCVLVCPFGAVRESKEGVVEKCELCTSNACGKPACVEGCPNGAIVFEER